MIQNSNNSKWTEQPLVNKSQFTYMIRSYKEKQQMRKWTRTNCSMNKKQIEQNAVREKCRADCHWREVQNRIPPEWSMQNAGKCMLPKRTRKKVGMHTAVGMVQSRSRNKRGMVQSRWKKVGTLLLSKCCTLLLERKKRGRCCWREREEEQEDAVEFQKSEGKWKP